jgi:hypothetical protein
MPVTCCAVIEVDEVAALRLLAVVVLPMVLLAIVLVPPVTWMPTTEAEMVLANPFAVIEPMALLEIATVPLPADPMPMAGPPFPEVMTETEPVPVPLPIVLPAVVPMFAEPADT